MSSTRVIAVLGYSGRHGRGLHKTCVARLRRAEEEARPSDVVLLSGWARGRRPASEAELMARSWSTPCYGVVLDRGARSTLGNVAGAASLARAVSADEVVLVTSGWHARRASALLRAALHGRTAEVTVATTGERPSVRTRLRELACWAAFPIGAVSLRWGFSPRVGARSRPRPAHRR